MSGFAEFFFVAALVVIVVSILIAVAMDEASQGTAKEITAMCQDHGDVRRCQRAGSKEDDLCDSEKVREEVMGDTVKAILVAIAIAMPASLFFMVLLYGIEWLVEIVKQFR